MIFFVLCIYVCVCTYVCRYKYDQKSSKQPLNDFSAKSDQKKRKKNERKASAEF